MPSGDHNAEKNKFFAIASGMLPPDSPQDATAALISPYLVVSDHPKECFGFWVYFAVSTYFKRMLNFDSLQKRLSSFLHV